MAHYGFLEPPEEDSLHALRLLNFEEKNLKRLVKHVLEAATQLSDDSVSRDTAEITQDSTSVPLNAYQGDKLTAWKDEILLDFANFDSNVIRAQLVMNSNHLERSRYAAEKVRIGETARTVRQNNANLHEQLREAQQTLEIRKGWDRLTEKITNSKTLKSREEQRVQLEKLNIEISELRAESQDYARTWAERREQFGKIVDEGTHLLRLIRDEKEEAERKEGMDDADDDGTASPSRMELSRAGTPNTETMHVRSSSNQNNRNEISMVKSATANLLESDKRQEDANVF